MRSLMARSRYGRNTWRPSLWAIQSLQDCLKAAKELSINLEDRSGGRGIQMEA